MNQSCDHVRSLFSDYLDGALTGHEMMDISSHMESCSDCAQEFASWRVMQQNLAMIGTAKAPENLGLKLRLAISREKVKDAFTWKDRLELVWANSVRPFAMRATAGLASATVVVGGMMGMLTAFTPTAQSVLADDDLGAYTQPHFKYSAANVDAMVVDTENPVVVEALLNSRGQVYDYNVVSGTLSAESRRNLEQRLLVSVYEPAKVFGTPVRSRVILTFSGISVRG
ncbi:anti-sigma factor [Terriglobus tenax]|uniref:anti-sigma factor n=1 Tax=Terriglobus tenax TaxID=1111115 RepID=UPI0021DFD442|nr:anti-sigma factor [Terriglobus tenax]